MAAKKLFWIIFIIILIIIASIVLYLYLNRETPGSFTSDVVKTILNISQNENGAIILNWWNLPEDSAQIKIYNSLDNGSSWYEWKTFIVNKKTAFGSMEIPMSGNDAGLSGIYYIQVLSNTNGTLFSSSNNPQSLSASSEQSPTNPSSENQLSSNQLPAEKTIPNITPPSINSSIIENHYYSPASSPSFWVEYVNNKMEIGWHNLPANIDKAVVSRSKDLINNWVDLFEQQNPELMGLYFIHLVDNTFHELYYYRLKIYLGENLVATYGPVALQPLMQ